MLATHTCHQYQRQSEIEVPRVDIFAGRRVHAQLRQEGVGIPHGTLCITLAYSSDSIETGVTKVGILKKF
jgi:hypothetical protein